MARFIERFVSVALAAAAACSPPDVSSTVAGACADQAFAVCTRDETCSPIVLAVRYPSFQACMANITSTCAANLSAPSTGVTIAYDRACAAATSNATWSCVDFLATLNPPPECVPVAGYLANGGACAFPSQCQSAFCAVAPGNECGVCADAPQLGTSCASLITCGRGFSCNSLAQCIPTTYAQQPCGPSIANCAEGLGCANGTCLPGVSTLGAKCDATGEGCDFLAGLTCDALKGTCAQAPLAGSGQPCGEQFNVNVRCGGGGRCVSGTCRPVSFVGGSCDIAKGPDCLGAARCVVPSGAGTSGTCVFPDGNHCH